MAIPLFKPSIRRKDMDSVLTCLVNDALGPGEEHKQFVKMLADYIGVAGGIAFREPHRALKTALYALELEPKASVLLSPLSPGYYMDVLKELDLEPRFVDVEAETACFHVSALEKNIDASTGALLLHYPLGLVQNIEEIIELPVPVIEDITESIGSNTGNAMAGSSGRFTLVGTEPENIITSGGGTVLLARNTRDLGKIRALTADFFKELFLPDINAALGRVQIKEIEKHITARAEIAKIFADAAAKSKHTLLRQKGDAEQVWYSFPVVLHSGMKDVKQYAAKKHVETGPAFSGTAFERFPDPDSGCPEAKNLILRSILFPLYPSLGKKNIETIAKVIATIP
jgi:perosamine synthetase